jgi:hypothetical protein
MCPALEAAAESAPALGSSARYGTPRNADGRSRMGSDPDGEATGALNQGRFDNLNDWNPTGVPQFGDTAVISTAQLNTE